MRSPARPDKSNSTPPTRAIKARRVRVVFVGGLFLALLPACSTTLDLPPDPTIAARPADWDDIDAAVEVLQTRMELGLLSRTVNEEGRRYRLLSINDEIVTLDFRKDGSGVTVACAFEMRNPEREQVMIDAILQRLDDLRGVDVAPVD